MKGEERVNLLRPRQANRALSWSTQRDIFPEAIYLANPRSHVLLRPTREGR
jgi:hypothetical protein